MLLLVGLTLIGVVVVNGGDLYTTYLPSDMQLSQFIRAGETKRLLYRYAGGELTLTVSTCSGPVQWYVNPMESPVSAPTWQYTDDWTTMRLAHPSGQQHSMEVHLTAVKVDTFVNLYMSTEHGGAEVLRNRSSMIRLVPRMRKQHVTLRWNASAVDPHRTHYCIQVLDTVPYTPASLCRTDPKRTTCVQRRTQYTLTAIQPHLTYHIALYAINLQSNFSYAYGSTHFNYQDLFGSTTNNSRANHAARNKAIMVKDGKSTMVNMRRTEGRTMLLYKVTRRAHAHNQNSPATANTTTTTTTTTIHVFVVWACRSNHSPITVGVRQRRSIGAPDAWFTQQIDAPFGHLQFGAVSIPSRYQIKLQGHADVVEVFVSTDGTMKHVTLPAMPNDTRVHEYHAMRTCDALTIGWMVPQCNINVVTSATQKIRYCVTLKEGKIRDHSTDAYWWCNKRRKVPAPPFHVQFCKHLQLGNESVHTERITHLRSGRSYVVTVSAQKTNAAGKPVGRALPYRPLQVQTLPSCQHGRANP